MVRTRSPILLVAVGVLALLLSACGSPTPTPTPQPVSTSVAPTATTAPAVAAATTAATEAATAAPTQAATTAAPTVAPTTAAATAAPTTAAPTVAPTTAAPTVAPTTAAPTVAPTTAAPTEAATTAPTEAGTAVALATTEATAAATVSATSAPTQEAAGTKPATLPSCASGATLIVGSDATYPPFESINETTGKIEGFDIDLLNAIGAKEGFTIDAHNALFDTIFTALSYGQFDVVASASTITAERQQTVNFSNPYFVAGQVIVARKADVNLYKTPADLAGKTIGVQLGTTGAEAAKGIPNTKAVQEYKTAPQAFQALADGGVDAVVNDNVTSLSIILNTPSLNLAVVGQPFTQEYYGLAVRKDCADVLKKINDGLAAVIADGTYAQIYAKYLGEEPGPAFQKGGAGLNGVPTPEATTAPAAATTEATPAATEAAPAATPAATEAATAAATP